MKMELSFRKRSPPVPTQPKTTVLTTSLLRDGADPNARCQESLLTATHLAAYFGQCDILEALLSTGGDPAAKDLEGFQPHHLIAFEFHHQHSIMCLKTILNQDNTLIDSPVQKPDQEDLRMRIADDQLDSFVHNHDEITNLVPKSVTQGSTLLLIAVKLGNKVLVEELLKMNADINRADEGQFTPLDAVIGFDEGAALSNTAYTTRSQLISPRMEGGEHGVTTRMLIRNKGKPTTRSLQCAVQAGNVEAVYDCLESVSPFGRDENERTLYHLAVDNCKKCSGNRMKYNEILEKLLNKGTADINLKDNTGRTPLFMAVDGGWMEDVELLLLNGADVTMRSSQGETVLHLAAKHGNFVLLNILLQYLSDQVVAEMVNSTTQRGYTPLFLAIEGGHLSCIELLLKYPCREKYFGKRTILHLAVMSSSETNIDTVKIIVTYMLSNNFSADYFNETNEDGLTSLELSASLGNEQCLKFLLSYQEIKTHFVASMQQKDKKFTALHLAVKGGHCETVEFLVDEYPAMIKIQDSRKRTPLILAALRGRERCVHLLLSRGANLADRDPFLKRGVIDIIMNYVPDPVEMIEDLLTSFMKENYIKVQPSTMATEVYDKSDESYEVLLEPCRTSERNQPESGNFEVSLDFKLLMAGSREMEVIEAMSDCEFGKLQQQFFLHPLVKSFLLLKWKLLNYVFKILSIVYIIHVSSVTGLALLFCQYQFSRLAWICRGGIWITTLPVIFVEILNWKLNGKIYSEAEIHTKWLACGTCLLLSVLPELWWGPHLASLTVLLSWMELLLFYAMSPKWGLYILMFFEVATNVFQVLSTFVFLIVGFALSFFVLFSGHHPFSSIWNSFCQVLSMISEFGYNQVFEDASETPSKAYGRVLYLSFLFLVVMVLTNIILGMSVGDVTQIVGEAKYLAKQGSFLSLMDKFSYSDSFFRLIPSSLQRLIARSFHSKLHYAIVYPNRPTSKRNPLDSTLLCEIMTMLTARKSRHPDNLNSLARLLRETETKVNKIYQTLEQIQKSTSGN